MKKNINIIAQFLTELISLTLFVGGIIMLISSLFTATPVFQSVMLIVSGLVMNGISAMHDRFSEMINLLANVLEKHNNQTENKNLTVEEIIITDKTTPEELTAIYERIPELKNELDNIINKIKDKTDCSHPIKETDSIFLKIAKIKELKTLLNEAIEQDEFEMAAKIKKELDELDKSV